MKNIRKWKLHHWKEKCRKFLYNAGEVMQTVSTTTRATDADMAENGDSTQECVLYARVPFHKSVSTIKWGFRGNFHKIPPCTIWIIFPGLSRQNRHFTAVGDHRGFSLSGWQYSLAVGSCGCSNEHSSSFHKTRKTSSPLDLKAAYLKKSSATWS
jgi:hypothetical protein